MSQSKQLQLNATEMTYNKQRFLNDTFRCSVVRFASMVNTSGIPVEVICRGIYPGESAKFLLRTPTQEIELNMDLTTCRVEAKENLMVEEDSVILTFTVEYEEVHAEPVQVV